MTESAVEFSKISPALVHLRAPIGAFQPHPNNTRMGNVDAIAASLAKFGQQKPIVVQQSTSFIVAGNHTFKAANTLKWSHIAASVVEMDDATAAQYLVVDNATSDLADYEKAAHAAQLQALYDEGGQMSLAGTGIVVNEDLLDEWRALQGVEFDPEEPLLADYSKAPEPAITNVPDPEGTEANPLPPKKEIVMLLEPADAKLFSQRLSNLRSQYPEGGGITATILRAVATAHEHFYGSADPAAAQPASAPQADPESE